jgi:hypothetical protein
MRRLVASLTSLALALAAAPARAADAAASGVGRSATQPSVETDPAAVEPPASAPSRLRRWGSLGAVAGVYGAATTYMYFAWYHGQPDLPSFKLGGDGYFGGETYAGGADKLGHAWGSLAMSRVTSELLIRGGWTPWQAAVLGSSMTLGLFTAFEVKDGFYTEFSPGDAVFNALGAGLNVAMLAYPPLDELIDFRVEYFPSREYRALVGGRRPPLDPAAPRQVSLNFVEDYSGQRYLLALHLGALPWLRGAAWARLVDAAVGYETDDYKPEPIDPGRRRTRHLFVGLSVNMQGLVDLALVERGRVLAPRTRAVGHLVFELVNPPFGSAAVAGVTGSPDP